MDSGKTTRHCNREGCPANASSGVNQTDDRWLYRVCFHECFIFGCLRAIRSLASSTLPTTSNNELGC